MRALRALMLNPVEVGGRRVDVTLAIGFAGEGAKGGATRTIANAMLSAERAESGGGWHSHDSSEDEALDRDLSLLGELDEAVATGQLRVFYQPKLDIAKGVISSVEALVRWEHPTRGFMRPDLFIPLAEQNDRIGGLTMYVLRQTIADLLEWERNGNAISGAVNISAKLLTLGDFVTDVRRLVEESPIDPRRLVFEVTESAAMHDPAGAAAALRSFAELGIGISMDDYGTGQSTLSYLKQLPLGELKIDRSFVQFAHQNRSDGVLVRSTIELAHELGLKVVAEGVEDDGCLAFLRDAGCDLAQGYLISKPVDGVALYALLDKQRSLAA